MYPNVKAEMARRDLTLEQMAVLCGVSTSTMSGILNGKRRLSYKMATDIKANLGVDTPLEVLFSEKVVV